MTTLDQRIAELEEGIKGYETEYKTASETRKDLLLQTINTKSETLNRLLDEKKTQSGGKHRRSSWTPAEIAVHNLIDIAVAEPPPLPSIYVKFNFNQRGGRMQMNQFAVDYSFHGRIRRLGKRVLHCLIVFPSQDEDPQSISRLNAFMVVARSLPDFLHIKHGLSTKYSEFLARPFQVMKTTPRFVDDNGNSEEPVDAASELESVSGASSYN